MKKISKNVHLPEHIIPLKYKIHFEPDLENFTFSGDEEIELDIKKPSKTITLHSAEIEILEIQLVQNKESQTGKVSYKDKEELAIISFDKKIKGKTILKLKFTGILNDKMRGFYRSRYEHEGKTYHMGTTQFESTDARRAFPCFDEPSHKAVFEVSFKVPSDRTVISNTIESEIPEHFGGYKIVKFAPSPKMSSYLLAFIIGHFEFIEKKTKDGTLVRVFVTHGKKKQAEFALDTAVKCLEFYANYFGIKYPLPTLDLVAIPDFAAGAMENWGAVTYRETALLIDQDNSSIHNKQYVAIVIAHELAHQWFGNLVTMEWWTHLWLNEGFASYMEYLAADSIFPKWNLWTQFVYQDHGVALELDGLANTHAIEIDVHNPAEISEIFDAVSYSKGASIIRMLASYLGEKSFRDGLRIYLKKHSYSNASTNDLWDALEKSSGKPVKKMMQNWTRRPGYPLISVQNQGSTLNQGETLKISQQRFYSSPISAKKSKDNTIWMTPVSIISEQKKQEKQILLSKKTQTVILNSFQDLRKIPDRVRNDNDSWIKVNKNETGFFRVRYSQELLKKLENPIKEKKLPEEDRFGVIRDAFVLSEAGYLSTDQALELVSVYKNEISYIVWAEIASELYKIHNLISRSLLEGKLKNFAIDLFLEIGTKLGWEKKKSEEHLDTLLRSLVIGVLGRSGDKKTIQKALELFKLDKSGKKKLDSDLRGVVYVLVAENSGVKEYEYFMKKYKAEKFQEEKDRVLRALCSFKNKKLLQKTLDFVFSDEVKAQDSFKGVALIWGSYEGRDLAWRKVKKEWGNIVKKFGGGHLYNRFIKPASNFTSEKDAIDIELFFKKHDKKGLERTIDQALEQIRSNAAWLKRDKSRIELFLKNEH